MKASWKIYGQDIDFVCKRVERARCTHVKWSMCTINILDKCLQCCLCFPERFGSSTKLSSKYGLEGVYMFVCSVCHHFESMCDFHSCVHPRALWITWKSRIDWKLQISAPHATSRCALYFMCIIFFVASFACIRVEGYSKTWTSTDQNNLQACIFPAVINVSAPHLRACYIIWDVKDQQEGGPGLQELVLF